MLARMLALATGLALPSLLVTWPGPHAAIVSLVGASACACSRRARWLIPLFLGLALAFVRIHVALDARLPVECEGLDIEVIGRVVGLPDVRENYLRFRFDVERASIARCEVHRVELRSYHPLPLSGGQRWRFEVRLKRVHGFANPGGFDFEGDRWHRGISAAGYVRRGESTALLEAGTGLHAVRSRLGAALDARLPDTSAAGVVRALAIGDRNGIPSAYWEVLNLTGTTHLVVISGLHVGMVAASVFALALVALRAMGPWLARVPAPMLATIPALLSAAGYAALAGFSLPTQRAMVMVGVGLYAAANARRVSPALGIVTALVCVLLLDPLAPMASGFWLSFVAVAALIFVFVHRLDPNSRAWSRIARRTLWAQLSVFVALLLPLLVFTQRSALISPLANLLAIPLVGFLVVPMTLLGALSVNVLPSVSGVLLTGAEALVHHLFVMLEWMSRHAPVVSAGTLDGLTSVSLAVGCALILLPRGAVGRWLCVLAPLVLLVDVRDAPPHGHVRITTFDVGQGLSVLAETRTHALLYDAGARFGPGADAGALLVVPALRALGIRELDALIISHADNDHAGGVGSVVASVATRRLLVGSTGAGKAYPGLAEPCRDQLRWLWDGVSFELHHRADAASENDRSCVLLIVSSGGTALLPGDITAAAERTLEFDAGRVELLVAPHHGSRSSSSQAFVDAVAPRHVIFSVGYRNPYRHPDPMVVQRYRGVGSRLHVTSDEGALIWDSRVPSELVGWRSAHRRFWNW